MSMLRSYSFVKEDYINMGMLWSIFKPVARLDCKGCDYVLEIVESALDGKLKIDGVDTDGNAIFDLERYERKVEKNRKLEQARRHKREKVLLDDYDDLETEGVLADTISALQTEDIAESIVNKAELEWALKYLDENFFDLLVWEKMDIKIALRQANKGIPESIQLIKKVVDKYPIMAEIIHIILSCGKPLEEILKVDN